MDAAKRMRMVGDADVAAAKGRERGVEDERISLFSKVAGTKLGSHYNSTFLFFFNFSKI